MKGQVFLCVPGLKRVARLAGFVGLAGLVGCSNVSHLDSQRHLIRCLWATARYCPSF